MKTTGCTSHLFQNSSTQQWQRNRLKKGLMFLHFCQNFLPQFPQALLGWALFIVAFFVKYPQKNFSSEQTRCWRGTRGQGDAAEQGQRCKGEAVENLTPVTSARRMRCSVCLAPSSNILLAPSALAGHPKLMAPLSFEPLPGMFNVCSGKGRKNALFHIGNPGEKSCFLAAALDSKYSLTLQLSSLSGLSCLCLLLRLFLNINWQFK